MGTTKTVLAIGLLSIACAPLSESVEDASVDLNGGFERVEAGLPVNWIVYTPDTVPSGSFELRFDRADRREGEQSLQAVVEDFAGSLLGGASPQKEREELFVGERLGA